MTTADIITKILVPVLTAALGLLGGYVSRRRKGDPTIEALLDANRLLARQLQATQKRESLAQDALYEWQDKFHRLSEAKTGAALAVTAIAQTLAAPPPTATAEQGVPAP